MYASNNDQAGLKAYNAMRDAMCEDFIRADTENVSNVSEWYAAYIRHVGHDPSPTAYHSAIASAGMMFQAFKRNQARNA